MALITTPKLSNRGFVLAAGTSDPKPINLAKWPNVTIDEYQAELPCGLKDVRSILEPQAVRFSIEQPFGALFPDDGSTNWSNTMRGILWEMFGNLDIDPDGVIIDFNSLNTHAIEVKTGQFILGAHNYKPGIYMRKIGVEKLTLSWEANGILQVSADFIGIPDGKNIALDHINYPVSSIPEQNCGIVFDGFTEAASGFLIGAKRVEITITGTPVIRDYDLIAIPITDAVVSVDWDRNDFVPSTINETYYGEMDFHGLAGLFISLTGTLRRRWNGMADDEGVIVHRAEFNLKTLEIEFDF